MARSRSKIRRALFKKQRYHKGPTPLDEQSREQRRFSSGQKAALKSKLIAAGMLAAAALIVYFFGFIRKVEVEGLDANTASEVEQLVDDYFTQSWYKRFKLLADAESLTGSIELADSRFSGTSASIGWLNDTIVISSNVRQPAARWRAAGDVREYLIDINGVAYLDPLVDSSSLPLINDATGLEVALGGQVVGAGTLDFILLLQRQLDRQGIWTGRGRTYGLSESPRELRLNPAGLGYFIKLTSARSASDQAGELKAALSHLDSINRVPNQYIDLRIDDTAYYK